jgi:hypothetical protein
LNFELRQGVERSEAIERLGCLERLRPMAVVLGGSGHLEKAARQENGGYFIKTVTARDLQKKVKECADAWQSKRVVVTRRGAS